MKLLIGNTGRGGELAILTAFVEAYKKAVPNIEIEVLTSDNGQIYKPIFDNNPQVRWSGLDFKVESRPYFMQPVACWKHHAKKRAGEFDRVEFICEYGRPKNRLSIVNIYDSIKQKEFRFKDIVRRVMIYPGRQEEDFAEEIIKKHPDLVMISYVSKSATVVFNRENYQILADRLSKNRPVAFTGSLRDEPLDKHIDLRGISFAGLYAIAKRLRYFIGPDTATTWISTIMPGKLVILRGCRLYTPANTGFLASGFRNNSNTLEYDVLKKPVQEVINKVLAFLG